MRWLMATLVLAICSVGGALASAASPTYFQVQMEVSKDNEILLKPSSIVMEATPAEVTLGGNDDVAAGTKVKYVVLRSERNSSGTLLNAVDIQLFDKVQGNWVLRASPSAMLVDGVEGVLEVPYQDAMERYRKLKVVLTVSSLSTVSVAKMFDGKLPVPSSCPGSEFSETGVVNKGAFVSSAATSRLNCYSCTCIDNKSSVTCCGTVSCCACGVCCAPSVEFGLQ